MTNIFLLWNLFNNKTSFPRWLGSQILSVVSNNFQLQNLRKTMIISLFSSTTLIFLVKLSSFYKSRITYFAFRSFFFSHELQSCGKSCLYQIEIFHHIPHIQSTFLMFKFFCALLDFSLTSFVFDIFHI